MNQGDLLLVNLHGVLLPQEGKIPEGLWFRSQTPRWMIKLLTIRELTSLVRNRTSPKCLDPYHYQGSANCSLAGVLPKPNSQTLFDQENSDHGLREK
jgi:hypothetical protein